MMGDNPIGASSHMEKKKEKNKPKICPKSAKLKPPL
jgi:hypothetical protein